MKTFVIFFFLKVIVFVSTGQDLLFFSWWAADEDAEDAHPSSHHIQVGQSTDTQYDKENHCNQNHEALQQSAFCRVQLDFLKVDCFVFLY